jgi:hypothetical protein
MTKINLSLDLVEYERLIDLLLILDGYLTSDHLITSKLISFGIYDDLRNKDNARKLLKNIKDCETLKKDLNIQVKQQCLKESNYRRRAIAKMKALLGNDLRA